jgi:hypothetical protein
VGADAGWRRLAAAGAMTVAAAVGLVACSLPGEKSTLSLKEKVSALASNCGARSAGGQITNNASEKVVVSLKVAWLDLGGNTLASGDVPTADVPANSSVTWTAKPDKAAPAALSCTAQITSVGAA